MGKTTTKQFNEFFRREREFYEELYELMVKHKITYIGCPEHMDQESPFSPANLNFGDGVFPAEGGTFIKRDGSKISTQCLWLDIEHEKQSELDFILDQIKKLDEDKMYKFMESLDKAMIMAIDQSKL